MKMKHKKDVFDGISSLDARAYLQAQGWKEVDSVKDKAIIFQRDTNNDYNNEIIEILLPLRKELGDYALRMAELVQALADYEDRPELTVITDIGRSGVDVIRIRMTEGSPDGTLPLSITSDVLNKAKDMLLAAACAAQQPRISYGPRKPEEAVRYLELVRVGQTERGSYVLTIFSPVAPSLQLSLPFEKEKEEADDAPYERLATITLATALGSLREATVHILAGSDFSPFEKAVSKGVSANLCEAVAGIAQSAGNTEISLTWARTRPHPKNILVNKFSFDRDTASIITEAARVFRQSEPQPDLILTGWVYQLQRQQGDHEGAIKLTAHVEGKPKMVKIILSTKDYQIAVRAHQQHKLVSIEGDLLSKGKATELYNPRKLTVIEEE